MKLDTLKNSREFKVVQLQGKRFQTPFFILLYHPSDFCRVGLIVSRKVGNSVVRNYVKRKLRHALSTVELPKNYELVVIPKKAIIEANFQELLAEFTKATEYLKTRKNA
jgi:ribonuclease P protein component